MLILCIFSTIGPKGVCCPASWGDCQYFHPADRFSFDEGSALVVNNRLTKSKDGHPFLDGRVNTIGSSFGDWVYYENARKRHGHQKTMKIVVNWWTKGFLVINTDCAEWHNLALRLFQWNFYSVLKLWFVILARIAISSQCTNPVIFSKLEEESLPFVVCFGNTTCPSILL